MSQSLPPGFGDWKGDSKYELRGTLGAGAMGVVLDGFDRAIERRVAIKLVRKPDAEDAESVEAAARFKREAQAAGRLSHPGIVAVYDYGENDDTAWIVMEMVAGGTLKALMDRNERMPLREVSRIMGQVLAALSYAHGRGVIHRDIKPANVMLTPEGDAKLADFGIARLENSAMTQVGTLMGTPSYMAPEQLRGEALDARADIWSAGVMLYQLLTGEKPFPGGFSAVMHKVLNTEPSPPSALSSSVPPLLDVVVLKALAKRPDERWPDALAFAAALDAAVNGPAMVAEDATIISPSAPRVVAAGMPPPPPAAPKGRPGWLLPAAGVGIIALGAAGFLLWPGDATPPAQDRTVVQAAPQPGSIVTAPAVSAPPPGDAITPPQPPAMVPTPQQAIVAQPVPALQTTAPLPAIVTPMPVPPPPSAAPAPVPRFDWPAIAASAAASAPCGLLSTQVEEGGFRLRGVLPPGEAETLRRGLAERNLPAGAARLELSTFGGALCPLVASLRPALGDLADAPVVAVDGPAPLRKGQLLRFSVQMPAWANHLHVAYATSDGSVARLEPGGPRAPGARLRFGEPQPGFPGWEIDEPFGTDLLLVIASEGPLFPEGAPQVETQSAFAGAVRTAMQAARGAGRRVALTPVVVDTVAR